MNTHPPRVDTTGFDKEALRDVSLEKLSELNLGSEVRERDARTREEFAYWALNNSTRYSTAWFYAQVYLYQLESKREEFRVWLKYWERVGGLYQKPNFKEGFTDEDLQRAREYPVENLVGSWKKSGNKLFAPCPFHEEKIPSFCIYSDNSWHCFGCNQHGQNAIDFLIQKEDVDFKEAVRRLL